MYEYSAPRACTSAGFYFCRAEQLFFIGNIGERQTKYSKMEPPLAHSAPAEDEDSYVKARLFEALGPEGRVLLARRMQRYQADCVAFAEEACAERERKASQQMHAAREQLHEQTERYAALFAQRQAELEARAKTRGAALEEDYAARHETVRAQLEEERATMVRYSFISWIV